MTKAELFEPMVQAYIEDFEKNNSPGARDETPKWEAVAVFQQHWNLEADDMLAMWKKSIGKAEFINTSYTYPASGIQGLLSDKAHPEYTTLVRSAFQSLFSDDNGDYEARLNRIDAFINTINGAIKKKNGENSSSQQNRVATITYLNLWDPDHNYRYKPEPANCWAVYVENVNYSTGQYFSLKKYYEMCDELREYIAQHKKLLSVHRTRFQNGLADYDRELHILTFDVLYCAWGKLGDMEKLKASKKAQKLLIQKKKLQSEIEAIQQSIVALQPYQEDMPKDFPVKHFSYGAGIANINAYGNFAVTFPKRQTAFFNYPEACEQGILTVSPSVFEQVKSNQPAFLKLNNLKTQLKEKQEELSKLK